MGYSTRGSITDFEPDDTDTEMYIVSTGETLDDIIEKARTKWGKDINLGDIIIESEKIHTSCIYYDGYDGGDWTNYLKLTLVKA